MVSPSSSIESTKHYTNNSLFCCVSLTRLLTDVIAAGLEGAKAVILENFIMPRDVRS